MGNCGEFEGVVGSANLTIVDNGWRATEALMIDVSLVMRF